MKLIIFLLLSLYGGGVADPTTWSYRNREVTPLGIVRVTRYSHFEGGRITASGYLLKDEDAGKVCAVGRDWWKKFIKPGESIWVEGFSEPCKVLDTMAIKNSKGLLQTTWVDIYIPDPKEGLAFGIQKRPAYLIR